MTPDTRQCAALMTPNDGAAAATDSVIFTFGICRLMSDAQSTCCVGVPAACCARTRGPKSAAPTMMTVPSTTRAITPDRAISAPPVELDPTILRVIGPGAGEEYRRRQSPYFG